MSLGAYYEALPSKRLPSLFQLWHCGQKWLCSGVTIFTLAHYRENIKHIFFSESTRPRALICLCLFICIHLSIISTEVYFYIPIHYIHTFKTKVLLKLQIHRILTAVMLGVIMLFSDLTNGHIR